MLFTTTWSKIGSNLTLIGEALGSCYSLHEENFCFVAQVLVRLGRSLGGSLVELRVQRICTYEWAGKGMSVGGRRSRVGVDSRAGLKLTVGGRKPFCVQESGNRPKL